MQVLKSFTKAYIDGLEIQAKCSSFGLAVFDWSVRVVPVQVMWGVLSFFLRVAAFHCFMQVSGTPRSHTCPTYFSSLFLFLGVSWTTKRPCIKPVAPRFSHQIAGSELDHRDRKSLKAHQNQRNSWTSIKNNEGQLGQPKSMKKTIVLTDPLGDL